MRERSGLVYLLVRRLFDERVARVAMVVQALDPRYILQAGVLGTESLFIFMMVWFMLLYVRAVESEQVPHYRGAAAVLGLAILTRPVPLLFPDPVNRACISSIVAKSVGQRCVAWGGSAS